jgi:uncharacterized protein YbaP (TraB family)
MLTLERNNVTMHLLGTIHMIPEGKLEEVFAAEDPVVHRLEESDALFLELGGWRSVVSDGDRYRELLVPGPGRPDVATMIEGWAPARRETFLENMKKFPMIENHVGRQETLLTQRPVLSMWDVQDFVMRIARVDASPSVEYWIANEAWRRDIPILGLETFDSRLEIFDALDQEIFLQTMEELFALDVSEEELREIVSSDLDLYYTAWASGTAEAPDVSALDSLLETQSTARVDAGETTALEEAYNRAVFYRREQEWVPKIDTYLDGNPATDTIFVAVGYAHISPDEGMFVELLQDAGWDIIDLYPEALDPTRFGLRESFAEGE